MGQWDNEKPKCQLEMELVISKRTHEMEAAAAIGHQDRGAWGWSAEAKILRVYIYFFSVFVLVKNKPSWKEVKVRKNN